MIFYLIQFHVKAPRFMVAKVSLKVNWINKYILELTALAFGRGVSNASKYIDLLIFLNINAKNNKKAC